MSTQTSSNRPTEDILKGKLREALIAIKKLKRELENNQGKTNEDIAIIGMSCRFPGGIKTLSDYWDLLDQGKNTITEIPKDRWDHEHFYSGDEITEGKINTKFGGFIDDVGQFDNSYFGISPIEAKYMDPQQRLLLEVSCEAFEHAGINIQSLQGSNTGIFVGSAAYDYSHKHLNSPNPEDISAYSITGGEMYAIPGRISYTLGLQGPAILVSTACSSSLVAVHQACQSLQLHESDLALAGGSNLIISPEAFIALAQMGALSIDGQCKAFDASANGYVRGEGVGMIALKRLSDAEKDGDPILAVIKGTAINQDGKSNGFTAPNAKAQELLIQTALEKSGLNISHLDLIEAHGTGTPLGDPIELQAITNVIKNSIAKREQPLWVGTVKSNFGHTEGAAGIAGIIKMVLAIQHQKIPKSLHYTTPNPHYNWSEKHVGIPQETMDWEKKSGLRVGGVSGFGVSGTNAHAVISEYIPKEKEAIKAPIKPLHLLPISGINLDAIQAYAAAYAQELAASPDKEFYNFTASALFHKTPLKNRMVVAARNKASLVAKLKALANDELDGFLDVNADNFEPKVAFVFPGHGSDWIGMGRQLMESEPVFKEHLENCDRTFHKFIEWSIISELQADSDNNRFSRIDIIQPITCAIQISLAKLWISKGVTPEGIIGHSMGEVAAAHIAGAISLENAAQIICRRSQLMHETKGQGTMAVVGLNVAQTTERLKPIADKVSVAVVNSAQSTVISGNPTEIHQLLDTLEAEGVFNRALKIDIASHSIQMENASQQLQEELSSTLLPKEGEVPFYSTVKAVETSGEQLTKDYWQSNLRQPVLFSKTAAQMIEDGFNTFIEISTHPILVNPLKQSFQQQDVEAVAIPSLLRNQDELESFWTAWSNLFAVNYELDWKLHFSDSYQFTNTLPAYPWQHKRFWINQVNYQVSGTSANQATEETTDLSIAEAVRQPKATNRLDLIKQTVRKELLKASGYQDDQVEDTNALTSLGVDSMMAMKIKSKLERQLKIAFNTNAFWKYNSIKELSGFLLILIEEESTLVKNKPLKKAAEKKDWFIVPQPKPEATLQAIVFHGAGESPMMYHHWSKAFDQQIELINVQLPGRGSRMDEKAYTDMPTLIADIIPALKAIITKPYVVFGHSMGGLIAFELCRTLVKQEMDLPLHLFISATPSYRLGTLKKLSHFTDAELIATFPDLAEENFPDKDFHTALLNTLRADLTMVDHYEYKKQAALPLPIMVIAGDQDELVNKEHVQAWETETNKEFELIMRKNGSHHYLREDWEFLVELIQKTTLETA